MKVTATNPNNTVFLVYANGVLLTPATWSGGFINNPCGQYPPPCSGVAVSASGTATFTIPQQNGYLALPSGPVQFTVVYDGWYGTTTNCGFRGCTTTSVQSNPSSANQIVNIVDDRTSADFSLQTDTTVNQPAPLVASTGITEAVYNLRLTSIYNFVSAYSTTPINLSCSIIGYSLGGVRSTVPSRQAWAAASIAFSQARQQACSSPPAIRASSPNSCSSAQPAATPLAATLPPRSLPPVGG